MLQGLSPLLKLSQEWYNELMKVIFRSKDFAHIEGAGLGFVNRRPGSQSWQYQGRVLHAKWRGTYECHWQGPELLWTVRGDARLFGLAAALKARGFAPEVEQDTPDANIN